jgi:hypothetical protein
MPEAQAKAAMERMGYRMDTAKLIDASNGIILFTVTDPYLPLENCQPKPGKNCTTIMLMMVPNPATKRREMASFSVKVWFGDAALISNIVEPALAKYGAPYSHYYELGKPPMGSLGYWKRRWTAASVPSVGLTLSVQTFSGEGEPAANETTREIVIDVRDPRVTRAAAAERDRKAPSSPGTSPRCQPDNTRLSSAG